eukprot:CAMPEP_0194306474 /NCGR_PEP_ID=MMETSP0171-20130528/3612_1 /TAXON_ID=218684 /ORGANISM="Corethron pennatum, Strain L29A3" /LENGTH=326 /DNA_ID=CAMNT_0039058259 /DNA_START=39 /DNA_END=1019 /DNA_ORIENTATION=-
MKLPITNRGIVQTTLGSVFYLFSDGRNGNLSSEKPPILCFHSSPRSSDEYAEVLPLLAASQSGGDDNDEGNSNGRLVIAFDLPGYGASENPQRSCTQDEIADALLGAADIIVSNLGGDGFDDEPRQQSFVVIGSLMGNFCCASLAARYPTRIEAGILTNPWHDPGAAASVSPTEISDPFVLKDDGSHLVELHSKRSSWLDPDLNLRVVRSELTYLANRRSRYASSPAIYIQSKEYDFETPAKAIASDGTTPVLCIVGDACEKLFDMFGLQATKRFAEASAMLKGDVNGNGFEEQRLAGDKSTLNIVNQMPDEFAAACNTFLAARGM